MMVAYLAEGCGELKLSERSSTTFVFSGSDNRNDGTYCLLSSRRSKMINVSKVRRRMKKLAFALEASRHSDE